MFANPTKTICLSLALAIIVSEPAAAAPLNFGAAGDSLTDEYSYWAPLVYSSPTAQNWVDQLATLRPTEVNFGTYQQWDAFNGVHVLDGPRYTGYEYNYARLGATSTTLLSEGQHTGVSSEPVDIVYIGIGTNNFIPFTDAAIATVDNYTPIYNGADPTPFINTLVSEFEAALDQIAGPAGSPTGVQVIVGTAGDWGDLPATIAAGFTDPARRALVTAAVLLANAQMTAIARARGIPVIDLYGLLNLLAAPDPLVVGDVTLLNGTAPSDNQLYETLPDGIHPGTVWQGLLANAVIRAANVGYDAGLTRISDQEILAVAGITDPNGGAVTSYFAVEEFVTPMPTPSTFVLLTIGGTLLAGYGRTRKRRAA